MSVAKVATTVSEITSLLSAAIGAIVNELALEGQTKTGITTNLQKAQVATQGLNAFAQLLSATEASGADTAAKTATAVLGATEIATATQQAVAATGVQAPTSPVA